MDNGGLPPTFAARQRPASRCYYLSYCTYVPDSHV
jgi:hypothetical protein